MCNRVQGDKSEKSSKIKLKFNQKTLEFFFNVLIRYRRASSFKPRPMIHLTNGLPRYRNRTLLNMLPMIHRDTSNWITISINCFEVGASLIIVIRIAFRFEFPFLIILDQRLLLVSIRIIRKITQFHGKTLLQFLSNSMKRDIARDHLTAMTSALLKSTREREDCDRQIAKNRSLFSHFRGKISWCDNFYEEILLTENVYFFAHHGRQFEHRSQ